MSIYYIVSSLLSYVFTTIIYLFIFCIIVLIYKDIKRLGKESQEVIDDLPEKEEESAEWTAILKFIKTSESAKFGLKTKYRIGAGPILIGRGEECDISIPDLYLSLEHLKIFCKDGQWYVQDLKSKNGTFVNEVRIKKTYKLEDDDVISFGDVKFNFHSE